MIQINFKSRVPIYEQLVEAYKEFIMKGIIPADERMPSVRNLSVELGVNPNTIQKAYRELERLGFIYTVKGRGSYVMKKDITLTSKEKEKLKDEIRKSFTCAIYGGLTVEEIKGILMEVAEGMV